MTIPLHLLDAIVDRALHEDLDGGDLTTEATVDPATRAVGTAVAKSPLVVCGADVFFRVFARLCPEVEREALAAEGQRVERGTPIWRVRGPAQALLMGERTALNLAQRMSGVATVSRRYVDALPAGSKVRIADTRKTTPGLRPLERYAVRCGGAFNHRDSLGSAVLIKDNHIVAAGGITAAITRARARAPHTSRLEVEVDTLAQLDEALAAGADVILLDNFSLDDLAAGVRRVAGRAIVEASGGVTLERIAAIAQTGVDVISSGALTHSAPAADISLDLSLG
jgi:nicotinate-nucleotide pyrophosphorylase (carboxylating)